MEVLALIGASGTGKSYRALLVAYENQVDVIIDDGLIIRDGHVIAGHSAKKQPTRIGATKAALFTDEENAREVRQKLAQLTPRRVLILGTSEKMVQHIASRLDLPAISRVIYIEDVASPAQISLAMQRRAKYGQHVIPAPTVELKPRLSGLLIDPLRIVLRHPQSPSGTRHHLWVEQSTVRPTFTFLGKFFITSHALEDIIKCSCRGLTGLAGIRHIHAEQQEAGLIITLEIAVRYGCCLPDVARQMQATVREAVELMTALHVKEIHISITKLAKVKEVLTAQNLPDNPPALGLPQPARPDHKYAATPRARVLVRHQ